MPHITDSLEAREATEAEQARQERIQKTRVETAAMHSAFITLQPLDYNARRRAMRWIAAALDDAEVPF